MTPNEEAMSYLLATEAYFQEQAIEIQEAKYLFNPSTDETDGFHIAIKVSDRFMFTKSCSTLLEEDLDLNRYMLLEEWTLLDHEVLSKTMNILLYDGIKSEDQYKYDGLLQDLIVKWKELEDQISTYHESQMATKQT